MKLVTFPGQVSLEIKEVGNGGRDIFALHLGDDEDSGAACILSVQKYRDHMGRQIRRPMLKLFDDSGVVNTAYLPDTPLSFEAAFWGNNANGADCTCIYRVHGDTESLTLYSYNPDMWRVDGDGCAEARRE